MYHAFCRACVYALLALLCIEFAYTSASAESRGRTCASSLARCPDVGCAKSESPDALVNELKHTIPRTRKPKVLTLDEFFELQDLADQRLGDDAEKSSLDETARLKIHNLRLESGRAVSEGDLVEVAGYVIGLPNRPKASGPESVNCRLHGRMNNDFHIPIAAEPDHTEFQGIVVEMIPQDRNKDWTVKKLRRIAREGRPVVIRGQLFYDNKHRVNSDPDDVLRSEPKRESLWEIHPVTEFFVCVARSRMCNTQNVKTQRWAPLEKFR